MEDRARARRDDRSLGRVRAGELGRQHPGRHRHVVGLDVVADAARRAFAGDEPRSTPREALTERRHAGVVQVGRDELDERGRDDGLVDHAVEQIVDRATVGRDVLLEVADVVFEDGDGERGAVGEVAVETALPDAGPLGDGAERRTEAGFGIDLARGGDESAAVVGPAAGPRLAFGGGIAVGTGVA